jgi:hypothetical protein
MPPIAPPADFSRIKLKRPALDLLEEKADAVAFLQAASKKRMWEDALAFVPQWLPARAAVWWGCLCVWQVVRGAAPSETAAALRAAADWALAPQETKRRAAEAAGTAVPIDNPAGNLALAAFYTGDSIAPADLPAVPPPPDLANQTVANAMTVLCARLHPDSKEQAVKHFVQLAIDICQGKLPWQS